MYMQNYIINFHLSSFFCSFYFYGSKSVGKNHKNFQLYIMCYEDTSCSVCELCRRSMLQCFECDSIILTHLVTPAFSATAIAASSAAVSTSGLRGRKEDVRKLNMSRGERTLEEKITNIKSISPPRSFSPLANPPYKVEIHLGSN